LDDPNPEVHHLADRALDLIEAESEVCDQMRQPAVEPAGKPMPSVASIAVPSVPPSSAEPPRAVRTPMSGYTGKPKKPD